MIPIRELSRILCPYPDSGRNILVFEFHCDLSYDGNPPGNVKGVRHEPRTYVFAGFFANDEVWQCIESGWSRINEKYQVPRFHAAHLNSKTHEYQGWDDPKKIAYSAEMLQVLHDQKKELSAVACGIFADEYRNIINEEGRRKMGSPYLLCFNSCISRVASAMDKRGFPKADRFSVLMDEDDGYLSAIANFQMMRSHPLFEHRHRLGTCTPGNMDELVVLQPADLIAYEAFKWLEEARKYGPEKMEPKRFPLQSLLKYNHVAEGYWSHETLLRDKPRIESIPCAVEGGLIIIPSN